MSGPSPRVVEAALEDMAAAGLQATDARWVRYAVERRRTPLQRALRRVPSEARRRMPHFPIRARLDEDEVAAALRARVAQGDRPPVPLLLDRPEAHEPPIDANRFLGAAGLPRTLIVPDVSLARLLLSHHLHLESGAPVLPFPEGSLPAWVSEGIERAGREARVLVLHDCRTETLAGLPALRSRLGLPAAARLSAVGLRPVHVRRLRLPTLRGPHPDSSVLRAAEAAGLSPSERRWLGGGGWAEAAAVPPDRLLRALRRLLLGVPRPARTPLLPARDASFV